MNCLDENELVAFADGSLEEARRSPAAEHLRSCEACRAVLATVYDASGRLRTSVTRERSGGSLLSAPQVPQFPPGTSIGRYEVREVLGEGGMGVVYGARDSQLDRRVALKFLRASHGPESTQRLSREAQALARIAHPNVVTVFDVGEHQGHVFIAMELVEGSTLAAWLETKPPPDDVLQAFLAAGRGLAAAHAVGVVHRDFKPANVLRHADGRVRVTDFGLALSTSAPAAAPESPMHALTQPGERPGTPAYMAPEQLAGGTVDARADQFGFCASLYEALYGVRAFAGRTMAEVRENIEAGRLQKPVTRPPLSSNVRSVLERGLAAKPSARFEDMTALLAALEPRRRLAPRLVLGVAALLLVGGVALRVVESRPKCPASAERLVGIWDSRVRGKLSARFASSKAPWAKALSESVAAGLDAYAAEWARSHTETCEATWVRKEQSEHALDLRMRCLDERRAELAAATRFLAQLESASLDKAPSVLRGLTSLERCADATRLERTGPPISPEARAASDATRATVLEAKVLHDSGRFQDASALITPLVSTLPSVADLSVQAEGWFWLGSVEMKLGTLDLAKEHLGRAVTTASVGGVQDVLLRALCQLVELAAVRLHDAKQTTEYRQLIELSRRTVAGDVELDGIIENQLGLAAFAEGQLDQALEHFRAARGHYERVKGPSGKNVLRAINNIGVLLSEQGKPSEALAELQTARGLLAAEYGELHPDVARAEVNLGVMYNDLSRFAEAAPHFELAEKIQLQAFGPVHVELAATHNNWGDTCMGTKDFAGALRHFETALSIREQALGATHLKLAGDLGGMASALLALDRREDAVKALERIVSLRAADAAHPEELARAEVTLAKELFVLSPKRARVILQSADAHFAAAGEPLAKERAAATTWLAEQPR